MGTEKTGVVHPSAANPEKRLEKKRKKWGGLVGCVYIDRRWGERGGNYTGCTKKTILILHFDES